MASQAKFLDFIDMIDGGGAGRMGDTFQGGGIFSALANLMATPYGSEDERRRASREAFLRSRGLLDEPDVASVAEPSARVAIPRVRPAPETLQYSGRGNVGMPTPPMQYSGRGNVGMPTPPMQYSGRGNVGMPTPPKEPLGVTTRDMVYDDYAKREAEILRRMEGSLDRLNSTANRDRLRLAGEKMGTINYGKYTDRGLMDEDRLNYITQSLMPPTPETMQYSGRGTASGNAEFDAFMNMIRNTPGQGALANDPELAFSIFQRMKAAGNLPSVMMYQ